MNAPKPWGGHRHPQDPPDNVSDAHLEFENSLTVPVRGYGHTVGHIGCLPGVVAAFLWRERRTTWIRGALTLPEPSFATP
jgi:hypothetical protein